MARKKAATKVFDPATFGKLVRMDRKRAGFSSAPKFSEAIKNKTGVYVDPDTLHKIERGEREPDITKLIAICATMYERELLGWSANMGSLIHQSQPVEFAFSEPKYALQREYIKQYKEKFGISPDFNHVSATCDYRVPDEYIPGSEKETSFAAMFRSNSKKFKAAKEEHEINLAKAKQEDPNVIAIF